jgi:hypothetical protein
MTSNLSVAYVTALYNINRENKGDGRKWDQYLEWFKCTLQHNAPMIIFIPNELESFVKEHRPDHLHTHIIIAPLEEVPYFKYNDAITDVINSDHFKRKMADTNRIECYLPMYSIIQYSKFEWLKKAAEVNSFKSDYYFWIDGGLSRFYDNNFHTNELNHNIINQFDKNPTRFYIQATPRLFEHIPDDYIWDNNAKIYGGVFGGKNNIVITMANEVTQLFEHYLYNEKVINNEQLLLLCLYKNKPELFCFLTHIYHEHPYTAIPRLLHGSFIHCQLFTK